MEGWRAVVREAITASLSAAPLTLGELFGRVRDDIPLHHAARSWAAGRNRPLAGNDWMRWSLFITRVRSLDVAFDPAWSKKDPLTRSSLVLPHGTRCVSCGKMFVQDKSHGNGGAVAPNCSTACGSVWREKQMRSLRAEAKQEETTVQHKATAQIVAAQKVIDALEELDDVELQDAVMAFVDVWLQRRKQKPGNGAWSAA